MIDYKGYNIMINQYSGLFYALINGILVKGATLNKVKLAIDHVLEAGGSK